MDWREGLLVLLIAFLCMVYDLMLPHAQSQPSPSQPDGDEEGETK